MARSFDDDANIKPKKDTAIPEFKGAAVGLNGVKAPASYKQTDEIADRVKAAGKEPGTELKR